MDPKTTTSAMPAAFQPAHTLIFEQGRTVSGVARVLDVSHSHLTLALRGRVRPSARLREELPKLLGAPLEELFEPWVLELPDGRRERTRKGIGPPGRQRLGVSPEELERRAQRLLEEAARRRRLIEEAS